MVDFLGRDSAGGEERSQARILEGDVAGYLTHLQRGLDSLALIVADFGLQFVDELAVACSRPPLVVADPRSCGGIVWGGVFRLLGRTFVLAACVHPRDAGSVAHLTFWPIAIGADCRGDMVAGGWVLQRGTFRAALTPPSLTKWDSTGFPPPRLRQARGRRSVP